MYMDQKLTPLFDRLVEFQQEQPVSFHVPGHKNGRLLSPSAIPYYDSILRLDLTELPGLDDLHAPEGVIAEAERLAAEYFQADHTYFLVGGSTSGNLAMILAACSAGDEVLVQRNSHKSIMNGLELSGAQPVFLSPDFDEEVDRYTSPSPSTLVAALKEHPQAKALVLTYPDYFGRTYNIKEMIDLAHSYHIPVLVDEAHGVHFSKGHPFPCSSLHYGADAVVHSAHKMAPAMTMASYLHVRSSRLRRDRVEYYLQMIQSSSPSYPLMASLDLARAYLASIKFQDIQTIMESIGKVRGLLASSDAWVVLPDTDYEDPLKITLHVKHSSTTKEIMGLLEKEGIYPEMATHNQILFIHGLAPFSRWDELGKAVKSVNERLKNKSGHATIDTAKFFSEPIQELALSYQEMTQLTHIDVSLREAEGRIAAEAVIPYPPGVPLIMKGERITPRQMDTLASLLEKGVRLQQRNTGIRVFRE
ncbi:aminotransferase class I/II-fold pyridoxal phosphate-dependent enzyme [Virgibacillus xinjiangensis]|uniref:Aminotransferase class I/II-fold pyridoxal phosphate-dependent enzyme n=1 Tax=Virgibacillus xinjiangensis TaxID=393090 RepID=A0ABV7CXB9_9BACI